MATVTIDELLGLTRPVRVVPVPEWGGRVHVRMMSAGEAEAYHAECQKPEHAGTLHLAARLAALCLCDANGARMLDDSEQAIAKCLNFTTNNLMAVYEAAAALNWKDAEGNSPSIQGKSSGSASPGPSDAPSNA